MQGLQGQPQAATSSPWTPSNPNQALSQGLRNRSSCQVGPAGQEGRGDDPRSPHRRPLVWAGTPSGAASTPPAASNASALVAAGRQQVQVMCGSLTGWLDVTDLSVQVAVGQVGALN